MVYSSIDKFKGSDIFDMVNSYNIIKYILFNVLCKNLNYPINWNYLSMIIVFEITIVVIFNVLHNVLNLLIETIKKFSKDSVYTIIFNYNTICDNEYQYIFYINLHKRVHYSISKHHCYILDILEKVNYQAKSQQD